METYQIAIYMRLSREDGECGSESSSIAMQRILLRRYAAENFSNYNLLEFIDDGYTGTNFQRPGMQALLEMVKESKIDCIIVKDFSRFARDYIELGSYLEQIFPFMGVRFISVNDGYDSRERQGGVADFDVNFKNLLYDLYSKDLSQKVRSSLAVRKEQGQYVSGNSPFGYEKDPKNGHRLLIEKDEAEIVRRIFSLTAEGYTSSQIARLFNETGVKTPIEFKIEKGKTSRVPKGGRFLWSSSGICRILRNQVYIGNIVQKKTTKEFVGGKNCLNSREEWLIAYGRHEPVIDRETFDKVQEGRGKKRNPAQKREHSLTGKLVCGGCKKNLCYRTGLNPYFYCHNRYTNTLENCVRRVNGMFMEQYVLLMLQEKLSADGELEKRRRESAERLEAGIKELRHKRQEMLSRAAKLRNIRLEEYQNYRFGRTDEFQVESETVKSVDIKLKNLDHSMEQMERDYAALVCDEDMGSAGSRFTVLTKEMIDQYIEKIEVYDEQNIVICWKVK